MHLTFSNRRQSSSNPLVIHLLQSSSYLFSYSVSSDKLPHLPRPQIQLVRRSYRSLHHVLSTFDVGPCGFAYDGSTVWALDSARESLSSGVIVASSEFRSFQYEDRLLKYCCRGFALSIPELDLNRIAPNLAEQGMFLCVGILMSVKSYYRGQHCRLRRVHFPIARLASLGIV